MFSSMRARRMMLSLVGTALGFITGSYNMPTGLGLDENSNHSSIPKLIAVTLLFSSALSLLRALSTYSVIV
jgi:hypothetical protein